ncbi:MAG: radical SAM protein [Spirochaetes bacterium]|nr:radical SAM protein [Spirochaetota bacterium]
MKKAYLAFCDIDGNVYKHPKVVAAFRQGRRFVPVDEKELIPIPDGSTLYMLPQRYPVDGKKFKAITHYNGNEIWAVAAFLSSGYLRTYLPAYTRKDGAPILSLWAYCGLVFVGDSFYVPALRIDPDPRSDPALHRNDIELFKKIKAIKQQYPQNSLVRQLAKCSTEYGCLCARNFFLSRYEAPLPTTKSCNALCLGCFSFQKDTGVHVSQYRLNREPTPEEIACVMLHHIDRVDKAIVSFGQGCEGEPLLRAKDLAKAIAIVRSKTTKGTIHLNTNGSLPQALKQCIDAGLDSVRISLNSPTEKYYTRYYRPKNYHFKDVMHSIEVALKAGIFVSINLFFLPGFTDAKSQVSALCTFLDNYPVNMIQTRNLNIDPDYYLDSIGFEDEDAIGVRQLLELLRKQYPMLKLGYYNPPKEEFKTIVNFD